MRTIASGSVTVETTPTNHLKITASDKAIINYESFNIGTDEQVSFIQPGKHSAVLNRVQSGDASALLGRLSSNGKVFLINPSGIIIGPNASINTGSFIASTLDIANEDFLSDRFVFTLKPGTEDSSIINYGTLSSPEGAIALLAPQIRNEGAISAQAGKVLLTSGEKIILDFAGDGLLSFSIDGAVKDAVITHLGAIDAAGGEVFLHLKAADTAIQKIVNTDGIEIATHMVEKEGVIQLVSGSAITSKNITVHGSGTVKIEMQGLLDASQPAEGGTVEVFGDKIVLEGAAIFANGKTGGGTVLIGGDYKGGGAMQKATLTYMDPASSIHADALVLGGGGKVILWSDQSTYFYGNVSARGGAEGGDGGFIETSGKHGLSIAMAHVDALAPRGKTGQWLMDPDHITVIGGGGATLADVICGAHPGTTQAIDPATINAALANVVLCAEADITVTDPISMSNNPFGITFQNTANNGRENIFLNNDVATNGGFITFSGPVYLGADVTIDATTGGGGTPTGADITFTNRIEGARSLIVNAGSNGNVFFNDAIGTQTPLSGILGLRASGANIHIFGDVWTASSPITFVGAATLTGPVNIDSTKIGGGGPITFASTVDGAFDLSMNAGGNTAIFDGLIGGTIPIGNLSVVGGTVAFDSIGSGPSAPGAASCTATAAPFIPVGIFLGGGNFVTTGPQTYSGEAIVNTDTVIRTTDSPIIFTSTLDPSADTNTLTIDAGASSISVGDFIGSSLASVSFGNIGLTGRGGITLNGTNILGPVGSGNLIINTPAQNGGITLYGGIYNAHYHEYHGPVLLGANTVITSADSNDIVIQGSIDSFNGTPQSLTIAAGGSASLYGDIGVVNPLDTVTINGVLGTVTLSAIGNANPGASSIDATGNLLQLSGGTYHTSGPQTYHSPVVIESTVAFVSDSNPIQFSSTLDGGFGCRVNAGNSTVEFDGDIGSHAGLTHFSVSGGGGITLNLSLINTSNNIFLRDFLILQSSVNIVSASSPVVLSGAINGIAAGAQNLSVSASTATINILGAIGDTIPLGSVLLVGNGGVSVHDISISSDVAGPSSGITLSSNTGIQLSGANYSCTNSMGMASGSFEADGNVTIGPSDTTVTTLDNTIVFSGNVDSLTGSAASLIVSSGNAAISIEGAGATNRLASLTLTTGNGDINFTGTGYYSGSQTFTTNPSNFFNIQEFAATTFDTSVVGTPGPILFNGGKLLVPTTTPLTSLTFNTNNENIFIQEISSSGIGTKIGSFVANAGTGIVTLGDAPTPPFSDLNINAGTIILSGPLFADALSLISGSSIQNLSTPVTMTATSNLLLDALAGNVGTIGSPIDISAPGGIVTVGASSTAYLTGVSGDGVVHCLPNNPPSLISFNGVIGCGGISPTPPPPFNPLTPQFFAPGSSSVFTNYLGSDFYFLEDRAAGCSGIYVHQNWQPVQERCLYNHTFAKPSVITHEQPPAALQPEPEVTEAAPSHHPFASLKEQWNHFVSKIKQFFRR